MGAELADLVPLEDVILAYPVQLAGGIVSHPFHLWKNNKIDAARCVSIVHATGTYSRYVTFLFILSFCFLSTENRSANVVKNDVCIICLINFVLLCT